MKIITRQSEDRKDHEALFAQGAGAVVKSGNNYAALWWEHTPELDGKEIGTIGACQLEHSADGAAFLTECAKILHQQYGKQIVVGPMNGNTWLRHRLVLESNSRDPFLMEPIEPDYFLELFQQAGFKQLSSYSSASIDLADKDHSLPQLAARLQKNGLEIRSIDMSCFEKELEAIFDVSLACFSHNFLYTPISKDLFIEKYKDAREHLDPNFVLLAERAGELVGYVFCMPDLLAKQNGKQVALIVKTLACKQERTYAGLGTLLVAKVHQRAMEQGYSEAIHALQYEKNSSHRISQRFDAKIFRRYGLMGTYL